MRIFRFAFFWMHLIAGVTAGVVILVMSVTGVSLTYEKQMLEWADFRQFPLVPPSAEARPLPPETLLAAVTGAQPGVAPTGLTRRADPSSPASVTLQGNRTLLVNPYTGVVLGEPSPGLRSFFRTMTNWHRVLAFEGTSRATGKMLTGVSNLAFLFIVLSGLYLWLPRIWTKLQFKRVLWFRRGLPSKARDFNWHNVIGVWSAIPLAIVVAGAVPISYPWAGNLVYRIVGETPPTPGGPGGPGGRGPGGPGGAGGPGGPEGAGESGAQRREQRPRSEAGARGERRSRGDAGEGADAPRPIALEGLAAAWARAEAQVPDWRTISLRLAGPATAPLAFQIDSGYGGQPQKRGTLTVDRATSTVAKWETFGDQSTGRRVRSWLRFSHTGEYYGLTGQTIAGLVSGGGAALVYTGLALAFRRCLAWVRRRRGARVLAMRPTSTA